LQQWTRSVCRGRQKSATDTVCLHGPLWAEYRVVYASVNYFTCRMGTQGRNAMQIDAKINSSFRVGNCKKALDER
jgi:hypothetical protein